MAILLEYHHIIVYLLLNSEHRTFQARAVLINAGQANAATVSFVLDPIS